MSIAETKNSRAALELVVRENFGKLLALLIRQYNDIELAEDVLQEAIQTALVKWSDKDVPVNPAAWLMRTAKNKAIDRIRRQKNLLKKTDEVRVLEEIFAATQSTPENMLDKDIPDERLRLIFTCCHPALAENVRVALTLKTLCGLTTAQIASAWLMEETAMAQRMTRAKRKIKTARIPYEVPDTDVLPERLASVLSVIYLIFNEGYFASTNTTLINTDLCEEAIYLAGVVLGLMPDQTEIMGLLALMYFHHSRSHARTDANGELVDLQNQDRSLWDQDLIQQGDKVLKAALMKGKPGLYQVQAAISAVHAHAKNFRQTDWRQIVMLYQRLQEYDDSPVVRLNLSVALSFAEDAQTALRYLDLTPDLQRLKNYHPYYTARADFLDRLGKHAEAQTMYEQAIACCDNEIERSYLRRKLQAI